MSTAHDPSLLEEGFAALTIGANLALSPLTRPWYASWGATPEECARTLPGDELVPHPRLVTTRAITIQAPPAAVFPWLLQLGQGRGGLYTFQRLENLAGCRIENVDDIRPELQDLEVGDRIGLGPEGYPAYDVAAIVPEQALVLVAGAGSATPGSWVFHVEPTGMAASRLLARWRMDYPPTTGNRIMWRAMTDPIMFVMERRMLIGIRDRAEALGATPAHLQTG
jgi:hypothetical protein